MAAMGFVALDIAVREQARWISAGGTAANVAAIYAYLGGRSRLVARLGRDQAADVVTHSLKGAGVDTQWLETDATVTTPVVIQSVDRGRPRYSLRCPACGHKFGRYSRVVSEGRHRAVEDVDILFVDRADAATAEAAASVRGNGGLVVFEPSVRGVVSHFTTTVQLAHVVKYSSQRSRSFANLVTGPARGQLWIETHGDLGLRYSVSGRPWKHLPAYETKVVDSAGSGDWTTAGLLISLGRSLTIEHLPDRRVADALRFGQALAAVNCLALGARGAMQWGLATVTELAYDAIRAGLPPVAEIRQEGQLNPANLCRTCEAVV